MPRVVIIGGGFSGLAAGVALTDAGYDVTLLEQRNHLGGRAYSFTDSQTGDVVDNGQHLFMRCYHHTIAFLEKIGCLDRLKFQHRPRVEFMDSSGLTAFECPPLPAPLHIAAGLFRMKGLGLGDKLRALRVGRAIRSGRLNGEALTVAQWLDSLGQTAEMKHRFWYPMATATLNEHPEVASALMMKRVLAESFSGDRNNTSIGIARVGLSDLYTEGARGYIEARGGEVQTCADARQLVIGKKQVTGVEMRGGELIQADYFISTVPPGALFRILPDDLKRAEFSYLNSLGTSPILSINLWFDRSITDCEFVGMLGTKTQWLFNKDRIYATGKQSNQVALVISAARGFVDAEKTELVEMALGELHQLFPESRKATLRHSVIVKERDATLAHTVQSDYLRPGPRSSIVNLILAGDWVDTGLPATIESAVVSGDMAAEIVMGMDRG